MYQEDRRPVIVSAITQAPTCRCEDADIRKGLRWFDACAGVSPDLKKTMYW